jgi:hypothetical protein
VLLAAGHRKEPNGLEPDTERAAAPASARRTHRTKKEEAACVSERGQAPEAMGMQPCCLGELPLASADLAQGAHSTRPAPVPGLHDQLPEETDSNGARIA